MKAIIISHDFAFSANAAATLSRVGREAGINVQWKTRWWPINALKDPTVSETALAEAADAHLILFPTQCVQPLPPFISQWLNRWIAVRTIQDAALGIMNFCSASELVKPATREILTFAQEHGLNLIADTAQGAEDPAGMAVPSSIEPEVPLPVGPAYLAGIAIQGSCRGFGINE